MRIPSVLRRLTPDRRLRDDLNQLIAAGRVSMGVQSYGLPHIETFAFDETRLRIGSYTSIAKSVTFLLGGNHPMDRVVTFPLRIRMDMDGAGGDGFPWSKGDIVVGNDAWIGFGATILSGVTLGDGCVVAAGSLVTKDVEPYTIVAGSPARVIRRRVPASVAQRLQDVSWWDWPESLIRKHVGLLAGPIDEEALNKLEEVARSRSAYRLAD